MAGVICGDHSPCVRHISTARLVVDEPDGPENGACGSFCAKSALMVPLALTDGLEVPLPPVTLRCWGGAGGAGNLS